MPTPILSPYAARGRSSFNGLSSGYFLRTTELPSDSALTICGWFKWDDTAGTNRALFAFDYAGGTVDVFTDGAANSLSLWTGARTDCANSPAPGRPFFCALVLAGTTATVYWKYPHGTAFQTASGSFLTQTRTRLVIGATVEYAGTEWDGAWWNVKCWDGALSESELLRESLSSAPVRLPNLHGWWPLEGNAYQLTLDCSGNGRHLTRVGSGMAWPSFMPAAAMRPVRRRAAVFIASGTQFTQALNCSTTASASIVRQTNAIRPASTTISAALTRAVAAMRSASTTPSSVVVRADAKTFSASNTLSATVQAIKTLLQSLTTSSTLSAAVARQVQAVRSASNTLLATAQRAAAIVKSTSSTLSAAAIRQAQRALTASTSVSAVMLRMAGKMLAAGSTLSATLATLKQAGGIALTASISTSAALARSISKGLLAGLGQIVTLTLPSGGSVVSDVIGRMRRRLRR